MQAFTCTIHRFLFLAFVLTRAQAASSPNKKHWT
jgi:hypothetical protein